ncbi:DUF1715 domain-containing protein [Ceratocystis lukuohia]|uniref:DUF1715 domain-containing protein n=1 Tax=Ceratocystis lukuohia TaxID=2019550 RepID=A0ABR4ML06_9PEZI
MDDIFEGAFNLEDEIYNKAYEEGHADGIWAGKVEGRSFGMAQGFDKFFEAGKLFSKAVVLGTRIAATPPGTANHAPDPSTPAKTPSAQDTTTAPTTTAGSAASTASEKTIPSLPPLQSNARLEKNIIALYDLMELDTLSTDNSDEAVNEFDDRLKRAQGKAKIIDRMLQNRPKNQAVSSS